MNAILSPVGQEPHRFCRKGLAPSTRVEPGVPSTRDFSRDGVGARSSRSQMKRPENGTQDGVERSDKNLRTPHHLRHSLHHKLRLVKMYPMRAFLCHQVPAFRRMRCNLRVLIQSLRRLVCA
jgi:hypothetical protein